ncbi:MAG TPA: hypothetical protein VM935_07770 [Chitinophagaceae bacterium]|nr:hypothetical protein [Chitinophagaceae bacterium]
MRKIIFSSLVLILAVSCNNEGGANAGSDQSTPKALDSTTQHPNGVTNGSVISTDTASMNTGRMVDSTNAK